MSGSFLNKDNARGLFLSFIVVMVAVAIYLFTGLLNMEDRLGIDFRLRLRGDRPPDPHIVIIAVDEPSIKALGRWPWNRDVHAKLIERLTAAGAKAIAFDILFTEEDQCGRTWSDEELGRAAAKSGRVIFGALFHYGEGGVPANPLFPIPQLQKENIGLGLVNIFPEVDGVTRKVPLVVETDGRLYSSLSFAAYAMSQNKTAEEAFNELKPPVDDSPWHEMYIDYVGTKGFQQFPYYSFVDVLENKVPAEAFKDKIVFVGGTAIGLFDFKSVPNISNFPGVEIHANALDNLLRHRFLNQESGLWDTIFVMVLFGLICGFLALKVPTWAGAISAAILFGYFGTCQWLFVHRQVVLNYLGPAFGVVFSYIVVFFIRFRRERTEKRWIRNTFAQYMSPKLVEVLAKDPGRMKLGGEERDMTIFFSDLKGFTSLSENMKANDLVHLLNEYLDEMTDIIMLKHDGYVDKYIGDAIMAFWNAPLDQPDHAARACLAALDQLDKLLELQKRFVERGLPSIDLRMGINTGHVIVGNMGSHNKFNYTVIGDPVNMASRLEGANKTFNTRIMLSEFAYEKAKNDVEVRPLDLLRVKGKQIPINVYELVARKDGLTAAQKTGFASYKEGMNFYREKKFERAISSFKKTLGSLPEDGPSKLYIERCENFIAFPPPPSWDGVYVMTTK